MIKYKPGTLLRYNDKNSSCYIEHMIILSYFLKNGEEYMLYYTVSNEGFKAIEDDLANTFFDSLLGCYEVLHEVV